MITYHKKAIVIRPENLDCMDADERDTLQGELRDLEKTLHNLRLYLLHKDNAENFRTVGHIVNAQKAETHADDLYAEIPDSLKW